MRPETERWLSYAREDLLNVRAMLAAGRWAAASFHAQQAAEKALKALYRERRDEEPPKIHDLVRIAEEVEAPEDWTEELDMLSRVYLITRYPGEAGIDYPPFGIEEEAAKEYCGLAEKVDAWVQQELVTES
jgi:HEPN domain-containing protein